MAMRMTAAMLLAATAVAQPAQGAADFYSTHPVLMDPYAHPGVPGMPPPPMMGYSAAAPPVVGPPVYDPHGAVAPAGFFTDRPAPVLGNMLQPGGWRVGPVAPAQYARFVETVRLRYTWLAGDRDPNEFGIHDFEGAVSFAWPGLLFTHEPILITPGFALHLWDAPALPTPPFPAAFELPSQLYSAYLDFYYAPQLSPRLAAELNFRIGAYSDFESFSSDAIRPQGYGAGIWQLSPTLAVKGGAAYLNRVDFKVLPVIGVLWTPDPFTHFDITFPNPKLSKFLCNWRSTDVWWYLAGELGGGTWHVQGVGDRLVDVNDLRAIVGLEWSGGHHAFKGFVEAGYVFDREVVIQGFGPRLRPDDTVMVRAGLAF